MKITNKITDQIKHLILKNEPNSKIYLYGSRARGDFRKDSDWDILILVNYEKITDKLEKNITDPLYDLEFEIGEVISPMIYSEKEWNAKYSITPYYQTLMNEGILL